MPDDDRPLDALVPMREVPLAPGNSLAERTLAGLRAPQGGTAEVPPAGEVWFGRSFDPSTLALAGKVGTATQSGSVAAVAHLTRPSASVNLMITGAGMTVVGAYGQSEVDADLFGWILTGSQFYSAGPYRVTVVDAGNNVLAVGGIAITEGQMPGDLGQDDEAIWDQVDEYVAETERLTGLGQENQALELLDRALAELPAGTVALLDARVTVLGGLRRWPEALSDVDKALQLTPSGQSRAVLLCNRAWILGHLDRGADALAAADEALGLSGDDPFLQSRILLNRSLALSKMGLDRHALATNLLGLELAPDDPDLWFDRACYHAKLDELDDAIAALETSIDLDSDHQRDKARSESDFDVLRSDPTLRRRFMALLSE